MRCILLYRLIFSAIPHTWVFRFSNLSFPSFSLIHLDKIPQGSLLYSSPSIKGYSFNSLILPPGRDSFIFSLTSLLQSHCLDSPWDTFWRISMIKCSCFPIFISVSLPSNGTWDPKVASALANLFSLLWAYSILKVWNSYSSLCTKVL